MVIGGDSCSKGRGFTSQHCILNGTFFTFICCKNCNVCCKRWTQTKKRPGIAHLKDSMLFFWWSNDKSTLPLLDGWNCQLFLQVISKMSNQEKGRLSNAAQFPGTEVSKWKIQNILKKANEMFSFLQSNHVPPFYSRSSVKDVFIKKLKRQQQQQQRRLLFSSHVRCSIENVCSVHNINKTTSSSSSR